MTKSKIIELITLPVGDTSGLIYGERAWNYFIEAVYEIIATLSPTELMVFGSSASGYNSPDLRGISSISISQLTKAQEVLSVYIDGKPAKLINQDEYRLMTTNSFYAPEVGESFYFFDAGKIVVLTAPARDPIQVRWEVKYVRDLHELQSASTNIDIPNSVVYRSVPLAVNKLKAEIGMQL